VGNAAVAEVGRAAGDEHPKYRLPALAALAEAGEPCLMPANSFSEYAPEPNPVTKKKDVV
jgi:hypothetical protein